jgi:hypothetical protein
MDLSDMHKKEMNRIGHGRQQSDYSSKSTNRVMENVQSQNSATSDSGTNGLPPTRHS